MERRKRLLLFLFCAAVLRTCKNAEDLGSCVAANFSECCEIQDSETCQLESGCRCDRSCYISDNCCFDIESICSPDLCTPNPCQNNGVCVTTSMSDFTCQCMYGYAGEFCETDINFCDSSPCLNDGNCTDGIFTFTCDCRPGFSGRQCQDNIDECERSPCHFGTCIDGEGEYACVCANGYTGVNCGLNIDDCDPNPCVNGTCIDGVDEYTCDCNPSFAGADCSIMTECSVAENTCQNNGLCNVTLEGHNRQIFCICLEGYEGDNCETDINECAENPCLNGGTCIDQVGGYLCDCPVDFTGENCSLEVDLCDPDTLPCQNGAVCREGECFCRNGFTGILCQIDIDDCLKAVCYNNATCIDEVAGFICQCSEGFTGEYCNISTFNLCSIFPCLNGGTCELTSNTEYSCTCSLGFTGTNCSEVIDLCLSAPCDANNTESCMSTGEEFVCVCLPGFTGLTCETEIDECTDLEPCVNGQCIDMVDNYTCVCDDGYKGRHCEDEIQECLSNPCLNNATCVDLEADYLCLCPMGYTGRSCDVNINECDSMPCANEGVCMDKVNGFECMCPNGFTGDMCQVNIDDCSPNPCGPNSTCIDQVANYTCDCVPGYGGRNCTIDIDLCDPPPCMNGGSCTQNLSQSTVVCSCPDGLQGQFCQSDIDECNAIPSPCMNGGTCHNTYGGFYCDCPSGFSGETCDDNIFDDCFPEVCMNNATCVDTGDEFECLCPPGYEGEICDLETLECSSDPCQNGGICHDEFLNFTCTCTADYTGRVCDINLNPCSSLPCMNGAECINGEAGSELFSCQCAPGYTGLLCDEDIDECESSPCLTGSTCVDMINNFTCDCASGFGGRLCNINVIDDCDLSYCLNGGTCEDIGDDYICICDSGFTGPNCEFGTNECLDNPCFNDGTCRDLYGSFECICQPGFTGPVCEMDMDECDGVNCNNGTCRDLVDGFSCDCTPGYVGERCDTEIDECAGVVCLFGGTCRDQVNNYTCECAIGFQGRHCEMNIDDCAQANCGNGTCLDLVDGYYCQCVMGYTGSACDAMINECDQEPCMNNASCVDALNTFTCLCLEGFEGRYCEVNIDECDHTPCLNGATCIDGINSYTCECTFGYGGEDCGLLLDFCAPDSCLNGGTCVTTAPGTPECLCTPLYNGSRCQDYIDLCQQETNLCLNGGECISLEQDGTPAFECNCVGPYRGNLCQIFDPCVSAPCSNNGTCVAEPTSVLDYQCSCVSPFLGYNCLYLDLCLLDQPCLNGGTCNNNLPSLTDVLASEDGRLPNQSSSCLCSPEFTGAQCETEITPCYYLPCENGGTCTLDSTSDYGYICQCPLTWHGINCSEEINIVTPSFTGASYFSHTLPTPASAEFNYSLALITAELSGLLLYVGQSHSYVALGLESGQVLLYLGTESDFVEQRSQVNVSDNEWHIIVLQVNAMEAVLQVDSQVERVNFSTQLDINTLVYVGGVPDFTLLPSDVSQTTGLVGCVHDRMYNGDSVELSVVEHKGRDIEQCLESLCTYIECQNGADCRELTVAPGFECQCFPLYSGSYCEIPLQICDPNPCQFGGLCREIQSTFSCQCPLGRGGRTCDEGISITVPSFSGDSYITYPPLHTSLHTLSVTITFTPTASSGVLFFVSTSEMEFYDYFSLALVDGRVEFRYNLGIGEHLVRNEAPVELYTWHVVTATLSSGRGELTVDNEPLIEGNQSIFTILNTQSNVWLGGYEDFVDLTPLVGTADGFRGCVLSLMIDDVDIDLIINADSGYGVTQCNTSSCTNQPCLNGGTCIEEGPSFVCVCPSGATGTLCNSRTGPCHVDPDLCAEGATCVNSEDGLSYTCLCPVGRGGGHCDEDVEILIPEFDSTSFLRYSPHFFGTPLSSVALTFNPTTPSGLLFYYGDNTKGRDFVSIVMIDQRVEYRYDLGSGPAILISGPVELNEWHHAVVSLSGPNGFLTVDGGDEIANDFEGLLSALDAVGDVFMGGVLNYSTVSPHVGTEVGFTGCISGMEINGLSVDLLGAAIGGRGIAECSAITCAGITCNNGGSCQVTGSSGPTCLCMLGFAGPTCDTAIDIQVPYFNGESYIAYNSLTGVFAMTTLNLEIRPSSPDGLILFNQQTDRADYIAVILRDGRIEFLYNLGSGTAIISSREPLEMNVWHTIEAYRSGASGRLIVDGTLPVNGSSPGDFNMLQLGDPLYIGGVRDQLPTQIRGTPGYQGCIRNVSSNGVPVELISGANHAVGVEECPLLPCTTSPCLNNGLCFVLSGNGSSGQQCLCSLPFTGDTCSERVENFSQASFNGQSYLQFSASDVQIHMQRISTLIEIVFTPSSLTGLLFYMGPVAGSGVHDYLYIALTEGLVELTFNLGSGEISIVTTQPLLIGENYTITVQRNSGSGVLSVSNGDSLSAEAPSGAFYFDSGNTFAAYLGGVPGVSSLTKGRYSSGLSGCVTAVSIGQVGSAQHLPFTNAMSSSAVETCS